MTNNEDDGKLDTQQVTVQAVHLISEILEEACTIVGTRPISNLWRDASCLKYNKQDEAYNENITYVISKDNLRNNNLKSPILTSTPQKGQGDQECVSNHDEMLKSTSMFITQLFDMSELEGVDELDIVDDKKESDLSLIEDIIKIIDTCVNNTISEVVASENDDVDDKELSEETSYSSYSLLSDAVNLKEINDLSFYMDDNNTATTSKIDFNIENNTAIDERINEESTVEMKERVCTDRGCFRRKAPRPRSSARRSRRGDNLKECAMDETTKENIYLKDLCTYENAYLTLNCDYEQYADIEPTLQDLKKLSLQEIDLRSQEALNKEQEQKSIELPTTSQDSAPGTGSRKNTLFHRCRIQGKRFFARCRSWWWRRRSIRKYKVHRGADRGMYPLSPDTRRRAASLVDHSQIDPPSHSSIWKFNTISEAIVHSSLWKKEILN